MATIRDSLLDLLFGTRNKSAFNSAAKSCTTAIDVNAFVADTILALKNEAVITGVGVDYGKMKDSDAFTQLRSVLYPCLAEFDPGLLNSLAEKKAFWINLYHLLTLDAVLQQNIQRSVTEGWLGIVRFFRNAAYIVGGMRFSLEDIEHGILRANRGLIFIPGRQFSKRDPRSAHCLDRLDARIHFALNCASRSCTPIAYYSADKLDAQLELSAANFIDSETELDKSGVALHISRIFKWYRKDFGGKHGALEWIHRYLPEKDMRRILIDHFDDKTMTVYKPYDWRLNADSGSEE